MSEARTFYLQKNVTVSEGNPTDNYNHLQVFRLGDLSDTTTNRWYSYLDVSHTPIGNYDGTIGSVIPYGATIERVELRLDISALVWSGETSAVTNIRPALSSWNQATLTFNNQPSLDPAIASFTRRSSDSTGEVTIDISDAVDYFQDLLDTDNEFFGFRMAGVAVTPAARRNLTSYTRVHDSGFAPRSPALIITYEEPDAFAFSETSVTDITSLSADVDYGVTSLGGGLLQKCGIHVRYSSGDTPTASDYTETAWDDSGDPNDPPYSFNTSVESQPGGPSVSPRYPTAWVTPFAVVSNWHVERTGSTVRIDFKTLESVTGKGGQGYTSSISGGQRTYGSGGAGAAKPLILGPGQLSLDGVTISPPGDGGGAADLYGHAPSYNSGGGGGGGAVLGSAGADGVAIVRYRTADAISSAFKTETDIFKPSIAFHNGKLFAPYNNLRAANIVTITEVNGEFISPTGGPFMFATTPGYYFVLMNNSGDPTIEGVWYSPYVNIQPGGGYLMIPSEQFDSPPTISVGARLMVLSQVGVQTIGDLYPDGAHLATSRSALEMSTVEKSFMFATVVHEPFRSDEWLEAFFRLDGVDIDPGGRRKSDTETVFDLYSKGFSIEMSVFMSSNHDKTIAPVIRAIHIAWDFVKDNIHEYHLACMRGADNGRWNFNPHEALQFVFKRSSDLLEFEDRFAGQYDGTIDEMELLQAGQSVEEGPGGVLRIKVVEEE